MCVYVYVYGCIRVDVFICVCVYVCRCVCVCVYVCMCVCVYVHVHVYVYVYVYVYFHVHRFQDVLFPYTEAWFSDTACCLTVISHEYDDIQSTLSALCSAPASSVAVNNITISSDSRRFATALCLFGLRY